MKEEAKSMSKRRLARVKSKFSILGVFEDHKNKAELPVRKILGERMEKMKLYRHDVLSQFRDFIFHFRNFCFLCIPDPILLLMLLLT